MHAHNEQTEDLSQDLKVIAEGLIKNPPRRIGYRERVLIERPLFLMLKEVCRQRLGYELQGLSEKHRRSIESAIENNADGRPLLSLLRGVFELRLFLLDLSSANPYVQGDALSRASVTKHDAPRSLGRALLRLLEQVEEQMGEQVPPAYPKERAEAPPGSAEA